MAQGNHFVSIESNGQPDPDVALEVLHVPWRSWQQFEQKVLHAGRAYEASPDLRPSKNHHGMKDYRRALAGRLMPAYMLRQPSPAEPARGSPRGVVPRGPVAARSPGRPAGRCARARPARTAARRPGRRAVRRVVRRGPGGARAPVHGARARARRRARPRRREPRPRPPPVAPARRGPRPACGSPPGRRRSASRRRRSLVEPPAASVGGCTADERPQRPPEPGRRPHAGRAGPTPPDAEAAHRRLPGGRPGTHVDGAWCSTAGSSTRSGTPRRLGAPPTRSRPRRTTSRRAAPRATRRTRSSTTGT
nr:hypothetical protein [Angustibacter aerolatus]